jgi:hypothetical protein
MKTFAAESEVVLAAVIFEETGGALTFTSVFLQAINSTIKAVMYSRFFISNTLLK